MFKQLIQVLGYKTYDIQYSRINLTHRMKYINGQILFLFLSDLKIITEIVGMNKLDLV